jgi:hypothetical protein
MFVSEVSHEVEDSFVIILRKNYGRDEVGGISFEYDTSGKIIIAS